MTIKNILYLSLSIIVFFTTMFIILMSSEPQGILDDSLSMQWILIYLFSLLLPIFNLAEIIINRDDWSKYYWLGLLFNIMTIIFIMRYFKIEWF
jgi:hypothetical protein